MKRARETLAAAAPYYAPRLSALAVASTHTNKISISEVLNVTLTPQEAMREYVKLIDQKPL